jgi:hypothetical protein
MTSFVNSNQSQGYPVFMSEYGPCSDGTNTFPDWLALMQTIDGSSMSWIGACGLINVGQSGTNGVSVFWPGD